MIICDFIKRNIIPYYTDITIQGYEMKSVSNMLYSCNEYVINLKHRKIIKIKNTLQDNYFLIFLNLKGGKNIANNYMLIKSFFNHISFFNNHYFIIIDTFGTYILINVHGDFLHMDTEPFLVKFISKDKNYILLFKNNKYIVLHNRNDYEFDNIVKITNSNFIGLKNNNWHLIKMSTGGLEEYIKLQDMIIVNYEIIDNTLKLKTNLPSNIYFQIDKDLDLISYIKTEIIKGDI